MAYASLTDLFTAIANSIRAKRGTTAAITAQNFPSQIDAITTFQFGYKDATLSSDSSSISFTGLSGSPKQFAVMFCQSSNSGYISSSYYRIAAVIKQTSSTTVYTLYVKPASSNNRAKLGRSTAITSSYNDGTFTLSGGASTSSPGQFLTGTYRLFYAY